MSATRATTKLDAINTMLSVLGEEPYNSITGSVTAEVRTAENILDEVTRRTVSRGWLFNTDEDWSLQPNESNEIALAANVASVRFPQYAKKQYTVRNGKVYDRLNRTYQITSTLTVDLVWFLSFEELPEAARRYITIRSAREFQGRYLASDQVQSFSQQEEFEALVNLVEHETDDRQSSILDHPDIHAGVLGYRDPGALGSFGSA